MLKLITFLFNNNKKKLKKYNKIVNEINHLKESLSKLSDIELQESFSNLRLNIKTELDLNKHVSKIFAIVKESSKRVLNMEHYDVQLIGGLCLHNGEIAEMKTGEGKTLVATLPAIANAILGQVHIVTVNDYLSQRDLEITKPLYDFLKITSGFINSTTDQYEKVNIYENDIVYITNHELAFDYLRDNMASSQELILQKEHKFVIVDEVDSILIDEARNPLIISGEADLVEEEYLKANKFALTLNEGEDVLNEKGQIESSSGDFVIKEKEQTVLLNDAGIEKIEAYYEVENVFELEQVKIFHNVTQALIAHHIKKIDIDYIIKDNEIKIIDQSTGRISEGIRYSDGLHQALEAKENVVILPESKTLATITYQNFFRIYDKLSGMTGTAQTEATEFWEIYKLDVLSIPTNNQIQRKDLKDLIYNNENSKFKAIAKKVKELKLKGQPVLLGTASIEQSEKLSKYLEKENVEHNILNAKNHFKEAEIIENAGKLGSVTVATNMAGRGVDIKVNQDVIELGGLYIIGTERHESRRIDNQLRGRSGRQGDMGTTQFYLSVEDRLMKIFGGDTLGNLMKKIGITDEDVIESNMVSRAIEKSQSKIEQYNFEMRKNLIDYDNVINDQRKIIYNLRRELLKNKDLIFEKIKEYKLFMLEKLISNFSLGKEDIEDLIKEFNEIFNINIPYKVLEDKSKHEIIEKLSSILDKSIEIRLEKLEDNQLKSILNNLLIEKLDFYWLEHLNSLDILKSGIGLRSYNQKDPLTEFKKDGYHMFISTIAEIKINSVKTIYNISAK